jgi:putative component of membrane protein insertase Oxa1/YidC/SpoIIIJ protein YidD
MNILKLLLLLLIKFYQKYISPLKRQSSCIYIPTCSSYALEAVEK